MPPSVAQSDYRTTLHKQQRNRAETPATARFWTGVAQKTRERDRSFSHKCLFLLDVYDWFQILVAAVRRERDRRCPHDTAPWRRDSGPNRLPERACENEGTGNPSASAEVEATDQRRCLGKIDESRGQVEDSCSPKQNHVVRSWTFLEADEVGVSIANVQEHSQRHRSIMIIGVLRITRPDDATTQFPARSKMALEPVFPGPPVRLGRG